MRAYQGRWKTGQINRDLAIVEDIIMNYGVALEQFEEFKKRVGKSRSVFFRYKSYLLGRQNSISFKKEIIDKDKCFFCQRDYGLIIHHINFNSLDNRKENLVCLCSNCHRRFHRIVPKNPTKV